MLYYKLRSYSCFQLKISGLVHVAYVPTSNVLKFTSFQINFENKLAFTGFIRSNLVVIGF